MVYQKVCSSNLDGSSFPKALRFADVKFMHVSSAKHLGLSGTFKLKVRRRINSTGRTGELRARAHTWGSRRAGRLARDPPFPWRRPRLCPRSRCMAAAPATAWAVFLVVLGPSRGREANVPWACVSRQSPTLAPAMALSALRRAPPKPSEAAWEALGQGWWRNHPTAISARGDFQEGSTQSPLHKTSSAPTCASSAPPGTPAPHFCFLPLVR